MPRFAFLKEMALAAGFVGAVAITDTAVAQIRTDGTLGSAQTLQGPNFLIPDTLGKTMGPNLFHSFADFNLHNGQSALFTGPGSISNILSRVTGSNPSTLDGLLASNIPGVNFFFINPNGVVFGPHAQINVGGSFVASTADAVHLQDGGVFHANNPSTSVLTSAPVSAFGFLSDNPAAIRVIGNTLQVKPGQELALVGGDIRIVGGKLLATGDETHVGGRVDLVGVGSAGEVKLDVSNAAAPIDVSSFPKLGTIGMTDGALVSTDGSGGGAIRVRSGDLRMDDSMLSSDTLGVERGQGVVIGLSGNLVMMSSSGVQSRASSAGHGGDINLQSEAARLRDGSFFSTKTSGSGDGGNIRLRANEVTMAGEDSFGGSGLNANSTHTMQGGRGGDIDLVTDTLNLADGAQISANTFGTGAGGNIQVQAGTVTLRGSFTAGATGLFAQTKGAIRGGAGGNIVVHADRLTAADGAEISTNTSGTGACGNIRVQAGEVTLRGIGSDGAGGLFAQTIDPKAGSQGGHGGAIDVQADRLTVAGGAEISASTGGAGAGGNLTIKASTVTLDGENGDFFTGIVAETHSGQNGGKGGDIRVDAKNLRIVHGADISTSTIGSGRGGTVTIKADTITLDDSGAGGFTGIDADTEADTNAGPGGDIIVETRELRIVNDARINASTLGSGAGGNVTIKADQITLAGSGNPDLPTGITAQTVLETNGGRGGDIQVQATNLRIVNGADIDAVTFGSGAGGKVTIRAEHITLDGSGSPGLFTGMSAETHFATDGGKGGDINVEATDLHLANGAEISASTVGSGSGGTLNVNVRQADLINDAQITSSASGIGDAGSVNVTATDTVTLDSNSSIATSAAHSNGGDIMINAGNLKLHDSSITGQASGNGGGINLKVKDLVYLQRSTLSAQAGGNGGNITIDPRFVILDKSHITADAIKGKGGNINITTNVFLPSADSSVTASSQFGLQGNVQVNSPNTNIGGSLVRLSSNLLTAESYLQDRCLVLNRAKSSSFTVRRKSIAPPAPSDLLLSIGGK